MYLGINISCLVISYQKSGSHIKQCTQVFFLRHSVSNRLGICTALLRNSGSQRWEWSATTNTIVHSSPDLWLWLSFSFCLFHSGWDLGPYVMYSGFVFQLCTISNPSAHLFPPLGFSFTLSKKIIPLKSF